MQFKFMIIKSNLIKIKIRWVAQNLYFDSNFESYVYNSPTLVIITDNFL